MRQIGAEEQIEEAQLSGEIVEPDVSALCESLRAFGYTTQAAIADLVDNSISAGATRVWISFEWAGSASYITLLDNGCGMSPDELKTAMRAGSRSPLLERDPRDLGRFGLGLKTASFSQCRVLTVGSKQAAGAVAVRRWDLDHIARAGKWFLLSGVRTGDEALLSPLEPEEHGTVVIWQNIDRIVDDSPASDRKAHQRFLGLIDVVESHLGMVFHRFLGRRFSIVINGHPVVAWDPFMENHAATQRLPDEPLWIRDQRILARGFVLPHHSRLSEDEHRGAAGPAGWNAQQGFYIYRGNRLLVSGNWLGLGFQKEEHYKLARLSIDLPNAVDLDWDIDVRKSRARPPGILRDPLLRLARLTRERAADVYRHRGKALARATSREYVFVWNRQVLRGKVRYEINRQHPLVEKLLGGRADATDGRALLRLVEETLPTPLIALDNSEHPDQLREPFEGLPAGEFARVLEQVYRCLREQNLSPLQVRTRLANMELFREHAEIIDAIEDAKVMAGSK